MSKPGCVLGVDYGTVRIGLAVSDAEQKFAFPLTTYARKNSTVDLQFFQDVIAKESIAQIVLGLPIHMSGEESRQSIEVQRFGDWISAGTNLSVSYWDERCTSVAAEEILWDAGLTHKKRKAMRDQLAAQIMLQSYLDARPAIEQVAPSDHEDRK